MKERRTLTEAETNERKKREQAKRKEHGKHARAEGGKWTGTDDYEGGYVVGPGKGRAKERNTWLGRVEVERRSVGTDVRGWVGWAG